MLHAIQLFQLRYDQGRPAAADALLTRVVDGTPELLTLRAALGVLRLATGRPAAAATILDELAGRDLGELAVEVSAMVTYCFSALIATGLDDRPRCAQVHRLLAPHAEQIAVWAVGLGIGSVAHHLGRLAAAAGDLDEADGHFAAAVRLEQRAGGRIWLARTHLEWAGVLLARRRPGDVDRAHALLADARSAARELRLRWIHRRAQEVAAGRLRT